MRKFIIIFLFTLLFIEGAAQPKHEVRAVWLTTNGGLDWPKGEYDITQQKADLCDILDKLAAANFNTIIFQAQVKGDVAWNSTKQPAMRAITGNGSNGLSYDVSQYVIDQCHKRNMECHAWIVPYRVGTQNEANYYKNNAVKHVTTTNPELCILYNNAYYLDPGLPATREYLLELYKELILNYNYDGVNFDYTRYPGSDFDDSESYTTYNPDGLPKEDWRRQNINTFITEFYEMAKSINPNIKVGAAPIGTYKNVPGYYNATAYGSYYQDACQWMQSGNHDLLIPQMYWNETYGFTPNMATWVNNCDDRQIVVGLAPYKMVDGSNDWETSVITDQIEKVRNQSGMSGVCFFRTDHVIGSSEKVVALYEALQDTYFKYPAHIVPMGYNGITYPNSPKNVYQERIGNEYVISWESPDTNTENTPIRYYSVYLCDGNNVDVNNHQQIVAYKLASNELRYSSSDNSLRFAVTAFDTNYYESAPAIAQISGIDDIRPNITDFYYYNDIITISATKDVDHIEIYSISGVCVKYIPTVGQNISIECNELPKGLYIVVTCSSDGCKSVNKFMR